MLGIVAKFIVKNLIFKIITVYTLYINSFGEINMLNNRTIKLFAVTTLSALSLPAPALDRFTKISVSGLALPRQCHWPSMRL
jgi:hypothetical protein